MKKLLTTLTTTLALTFALNANAKIGDTFIDPEFGTITVKAPKLQDRTVNFGEWTLESKHKKTDIDLFLDEMSGIASNFRNNFPEKLYANLTEKEIKTLTKELISGLQKLKPKREQFFKGEYSPKMVVHYTGAIEDIQRAFKYKFWDYFKKIKGTPEFEQLKNEINFSSQILDNLELYR